MAEWFSRLELEASVGMEAGPVVDVDFHGDRAVLLSGELKGFLIIASHQVGVGRHAGFDGGVLPRAADAGGLSKFPEVINTAEPERGLAVL